MNAGTARKARQKWKRSMITDEMVCVAAMMQQWMAGFTAHVLVKMTGAPWRVASRAIERAEKRGCVGMINNLHCHLTAEGEKLLGMSRTEESDVQFQSRLNKMMRKVEESKLLLLRDATPEQLMSALIGHAVEDVILYGEPGDGAVNASVIGESPLSVKYDPRKRLPLVFGDHNVGGPMLGPNEHWITRSAARAAYRQMNKGGADNE